MPIDIAVAKESLQKIDQALNTPHILIGGLAVEQFYKGRDSQDIDLVCDHKTSKALLRLFPNNDWDIEDNNDDAYRPSYKITHQIKKGIVIKFGPKISEREPYNYLNWEDFRKGATPFKYKGNEYTNILTPPSESLSFTKLVSAVERKHKSVSKSVQDFEDFINLSNHKSFNMNKFVHLLKKAEFDYDFVKDLSKLIIEYSDQWELSNLKYLLDTLVLGKPEHENLKDRVIEIHSEQSNHKIDGKFPLSAMYSETNEASKADLIERLNDAHSEFVAFGLTRNFYADKMAELLIERAKTIHIKIFLMNPDCASRVDRYRIEPIEAAFEDPKRFRRRIVDKYRRLLNTFDNDNNSGSIEVFFYDFPCSFAIEKIDNSIRVMLYGHGVRGTDGPIFVFAKGNKYFSYFNDQLSWLINMATGIYDEARGSDISIEKLL